MEYINSTGIQEIKTFLAANHKLGGDHFDEQMLNAWAEGAEFQIAEGNPPTIELKACDSIHGRTQTYTITDAGLTDDGKVLVHDNIVDFNAAVALMDDDIREALHSSKEWVSNQEFMDAYVAAHAEKFDGEEFRAD